MDEVIVKPNIVLPLLVSVVKIFKHKEGCGFSWSYNQFVCYPFESGARGVPLETRVSVESVLQFDRRVIDSQVNEDLLVYCKGGRW